MKTIGLCMIVKNEAPVLLRCLESVRPLLDYVLIEDTGSTDGTQALITSWLASQNLPGEVYDRPWTDFAANRSSALARLRLRPEIDYVLVIDADDVLVLAPGFDAVAFKQTIDADVYSLPIRLGPISYLRPQLSEKLRSRFERISYFSLRFLHASCTNQRLRATEFVLRRLNNCIRTCLNTGQP